MPLSPLPWPLTQGHTRRGSRVSKQKLPKGWTAFRAVSQLQISASGNLVRKQIDVIGLFGHLCPSIRT
jgi:hypothetical protein